MATKLKGVTVEIGGDTTELDKALKGVNQNIEKTSKELKEVNRLLKFDPKNVALLEQKQKLLNKQIDDTEEKLKAVKDAEKQAQKQFEKGDIGEDQYRKIQREVIETTQQLKKYENQLNDVHEAAERANVEAAESASGAGKGWETVALGVSSAADIIEIAVEALKQAYEVGQQIGTKISEILNEAVEGTTEYRRDLSKLKLNAEEAGVAFDEVSGHLSYLIAITDESDSSIEALSNLLKTGFKGNQLARAIELISGAVIQFPDTLKIESLADSLQETLATGEATGQFAELLERLGYNVENVNGALELFDSETQNRIYLLNLLADKGLGEVNKKYAEANKELIAYSEAQTNANNVMAEIGDKMQPAYTAIDNIKSQLLEAALPAVETFANALTEMLEDPAMQEAIAKLAEGLGEVVEAFAKWFADAASSGQLSEFISNLADRLPDIAETLVKITDALLGTEKTKGFLDAILAIIDVFGELLAVMAQANSLMTTFLNNVASFAGKNISRSFNPFGGGVNWYAEGGIFNSPSIIGVGEAGTEAVLPINKLEGILAGALARVGNTDGGNYSLNVYTQNLSDEQQTKLFQRFDRWAGRLTR